MKSSCWNITLHALLAVNIHHAWQVMSDSSVTIIGLVAVCHYFCLFFIFSNIHSIIQSHSYNTFAEASLHLLIACKLSGTDLLVVPSPESNSGLPSSKPTRYQLCHAAPYATPHHYSCFLSCCLLGGRGL